MNARVLANLQRRQIGEQFKILDPPRFPNAPLCPSRLVVDMAGALVGLALGVVMIGISTRHNKQIQPPEPSQV